MTTIADLCERIELWALAPTHRDGQKQFESISTVWGEVKPHKALGVDYTLDVGTAPLSRLGQMYYVTIRKNHSRYALHACVSRLIWNHKILDIVADWHMDTRKGFISTIAMDTRETHHG